METVSAKELRLELPKILKKISEGKEFTIIYRSKPVGEIGPIRHKKKTRRGRGIYGLLEKSFGEVIVPEGQSSVDLIRAERD
jgi:antitoxin (DNA-binding transcriptional repressor) of toxin-antitoxin stability system